MSSVPLSVVVALVLSVVVGEVINVLDRRLMPIAFTQLVEKNFAKIVDACLCAGSIVVMDLSSAAAVALPTQCPASVCCIFLLEK
jgi:tetrahydromethanopterin S-methyltransferase subunit C